MAKLISKTYGDALFELATEEDQVDMLFEEVTALRQILKENEELNNLMNHPKIAKEEKLHVMENIFSGRVSKELTGFLSLVIMKDRYGEIDHIFRYFIDRVKAMKGIGIAYVTTAAELKDSQKQQIVDKLIATTAYKEMEIHYAVDSKLIGGMLIRIGDRVVDSSVKTKLEELQRQLLKIQLA